MARLADNAIFEKKLENSGIAVILPTSSFFHSYQKKTQPSLGFVSYDQRVGPVPSLDLWNTSGPRPRRETSD